MPKSTPASPLQRAGTAVAKPLQAKVNPEKTKPGAWLTLCDVVPLGDGTFRLIPRKPKDEVTPLEAAKLLRASRSTVYRLLELGFLKARQPSPRKILVDAGSLNQFMEKSCDPEFWTPELKAKYNDVIPKHRGKD